MTMTIESIREVFAAQRYDHTRDTVKLDEFRSPTTSQFLYVFKERAPSSLFVVIHPELKLQPFLALPGVTCPKPDQFQHHSNMRDFPKRKHRGESETPYGRAFEINSLDALAQFLQLFDSPAGNEREGADRPPRLAAIELENFKGVGERVRIDMAPITLLFGANSAGKSTILQALQYMREILERRNANPDRTLYGGDFVDLGGFRNLVHGRDLSQRIKIKLEIELNRENLPDLVPETFDEWQTDSQDVWNFYSLLREIRGRAETASVELQVAWSSVKAAAFVVGYEVGLNGEWLVCIESVEDGRDAEIKINPQNPVFVRFRTQEEIEQDADIANALGEPDSPDDTIESPESETSSMASNEADLSNHEYSLWPGIRFSLDDAGIEGSAQGFRQWLTTIEGALPKLEPLLYVPTGKASGADAVYMAREFTAFLSSMVVGPAILMRDQLRKLRYLGPIRNVPERDFAAELTPDEARWADGTAAWETLLTGDESLVSEVSEWMSNNDRLATGYKVTRRNFKEVDAGTLTWLIRAADPDSGVRTDMSLLRDLELAPEKQRLDLVDMETDIKVQARDVGIGISQVLPVVVAALEPSASLVAIEQPELHIHPAVQVGLGDLLIRGAKTHGINFLIETHSEHLILRLLRRIRETTEHELPPDIPSVSPGDINVLYVERSAAKQAKIHPIGIDASGKFVGRWPRGFFPERMHEALPREIRERVETKRRGIE